MYAYPRPVRAGCGPDYRIASYNIALDFAQAGNVAAGHGVIYVTTRGTQPGVVVFSVRVRGFVSAYPFSAYLFSDYPNLNAPSGDRAEPLV